MKAKVQRKIVFDHDPEPDFSWLEQWNTPATYKGNEVIVNRKPLPFDEYMRTYGNPEYHVMLCMLVYELGPDADDWEIVDSLCGIDMLAHADDWATGTFYDLKHIPKGYLRTLAKEAGIK
jgi:hypothetical protein